MELQGKKIAIEKNYNDEPIIVVNSGEEKIFLNSQYNTEEFVDIWCKQFDISNAFSIAVVFGVSDGRYVKRLNEINKDMHIIVYEPYKEIAKCACELGYLEKADPEKVFVMTGKESLFALSHTIGNIIDYANIKYVRCFISPNYERICPDAINTIVQMVNNEKENAIVSRNTLYLLEENFKINSVKNLIDRIDQYSVADLINKIKSVIKDDIPAIVVAAGPSLDKNIKELKKAVGKSFIIAVDTSLNALAKENIIPDVCITIDPIKPVSLLANKQMEKVPLIYHLASNYEIARVHKGKRFYQDSSESIYDIFIKKFNKERCFLETGGSVANDACSLACFCEFKTIIFVGLDLAYPNDKEHSDYSYGKGHNNTINSCDETRYFFIEDINGNKVKTEHNMNIYRKWFESEVKTHNEIRFIDATEGGAKKNGMEIMTLKDAINETCNMRVAVNFSDIINSIEPEFSKDEQNEILKYIADYENKLKEIKKKIRQGINYYNSLDEYNRKQIYSGKGFETTYNNVSGINKWLAYDEEVAYMKKYVSSRIYEVMESIYEEKESLYEEIKFLVSNGKGSLEALLKATDVILEDYREDIEKAKEMLKEYEGV